MYIHSIGNNLKCQCYQRYQILLASDRGGPKKWTTDQYEQLFELVERYGPCWTKIGEIIGRTPHVCRLVSIM